MAAQQMPVRVLYTINNSPQCMLARTFDPVPVSLIYSATPSIAYGRTRLETCIQAINRASPELFNDDEEDYSLYLLDPLEAQQTASVFTSSSSGAQAQFPGVAVGLGLLSALSAPQSSSEDMSVTGIVSTGPGRVDSLEVVFNLKELKRRSKSSAKQPKKRTTATKKQESSNASSSHANTFASSSQTGLHPSNAVNVQDRHRYYRNKEELYTDLPTSSDHYGGHHLYQRSSSLPHLHRTTQHPIPVHQNAQNHSSSNSSTIASQPNQAAHVPSSQTSLQTVLSVLSSAKNTDVVLSVLSLIDAPKGSGSQTTQQTVCQQNQEPTTSTTRDHTTDPAFVEALKTLLAAAASTTATQGTDLPTPSAQSTPSPAPVDSSTFASSTHSRELNDGPVVQVNKENVNPIKCPENTGAEGKQKCNGDGNGSGLSFPQRPRLPSKSSPVSGSGSVRKKRTLSDIMDEKEQKRADARRTLPWRSSACASGHDGDEQTERKSYEGIDLEQVKQRLFYLSSQTQSDPSNGWNPSSFRSSPWATAKVKDARLVAGSTLTSSTENWTGAKKRFIVPDWAKTETATVPRLSEDAAAKLKVVEVEKKNASVNANLTKKVKHGAKERKRKLASAPTQEDCEENVDHAQSEQIVTGEPSTPKRAKVAKTNLIEFPIVATSSPAIFNSSPLASHSGGSATVMHSKTPKTPTRRRRNSSPSRTPRRNVIRAASVSPLFTPGSNSCTTPKLPSLFSNCSPSFGSRGRSSPPEIIMLSKRKQNKDRLLHSLPGASSDTEDNSPMKVLSSSPPPSSPILTSSDDESLQVMTFTAPNDNEVAYGVTTNFMQDFDWLTNTNMCPTGQPFPDFDAAELTRFAHGSLEGAAESELNEAQLAAEIFNWTSADGTGGGDGFQLGEFWTSVKPLMEESCAGGGMDNVEGVKLASEMVDLFGGCLM